MNAFLVLFRCKFNIGTVLIFLLIPLLSILYDGRRYKASNDIKEYRIIKVISYFYMVVGVVFFILLRM